MSELQAWRERIFNTAQMARRCIDADDEAFVLENLAPGKKQCQFCAAKGKCPALANYVEESIMGDLDDVNALGVRVANAPSSLEVSAERLAQFVAAVPLIQLWCDSVMENAHGRLSQGESIPGYKLVSGRAGSRKWASEEETISALKQMRLKDEVIYKQSLISPTQAEKLVKTGEIGPRQWAKLQELVTRSEPKPVLAPESDKRPALSIQPIENDLDDLVATHEGK